MKHYRPVTRSMCFFEVPTEEPVCAQTSFQTKVDFLVDLVDRAIVYLFQKESAL